NNDIDRRAYLEDVDQAIAFIEGRDEDIERTLVEKMNDLAAETRFEEAEMVRRKLDKIRRARQDYKDTFFSVWNFNYIAVLPSDSVSRCKIAFIRESGIIGFRQYEIETLEADLASDLRRFFETPIGRGSTRSQYDEFCLVSNFIIDPLQSVDILPVRGVEHLPERIAER